MVSRRAHKAAVYGFIGFLKVMGMVGGLMFYGDIGKEELGPKQPIGDTAEHIQVEVLLN